MRLFTACATPALVLALSLGACSPKPEAQAPPPTAPAVAQPAPAAPPKVIGLEGLADLRIGKALPVDGTWAERGAQTGDACRTVTSSDYPGVYAIVTDGQVRRITVGQRSDVTLAEGIGVGAPEADVMAAFAGFRAEPHKYVEVPAKYLTAPNAQSGEPALRFEIGADSKVSLIHVGIMPVLGYVEGCS